MSVSKSISLLKIKNELKKCSKYAEKCGWLITNIDESNLTFRVQMISPIDKEVYILEVLFSDYPELPLVLEFIDPKTGTKGVKSAYPKNDDSFFHPSPCICNPCSRKSYRVFNSSGPHSDWKMIGWQQNPRVTSLLNIDTILKTIYSRISNEEKYKGRMA